MNAARKTAASQAQVKDAFEEVKKSLTTQALTKTAIDMVGAIGQLGSALSSLKNLGNIWSDETLSGSDKLLQTFTALGTAIPMLLSSLKGLGMGFLTVGAAIMGSNSVLGLSLGLIKAKDAATKQSIISKMAEKGLIDESTAAEETNTAAILKEIIVKKLQDAATKGGIVGKLADAAANWALNTSMSPVLVITIMLVVAMLALAVAITWHILSYATLRK
jgi:hypothetical protein